MLALMHSASVIRRAVRAMRQRKWTRKMAKIDPEMVEKVERLRKIQVQTGRENTVITTAATTTAVHFLWMQIDANLQADACVVASRLSNVKVRKCKVNKASGTSFGGKETKAARTRCWCRIVPHHSRVSPYFQTAVFLVCHVTAGVLPETPAVDHLNAQFPLTPGNKDDEIGMYVQPFTPTTVVASRDESDAYHARLF